MMNPQEFEQQMQEMTHMLETANTLLEIALINFRQLTAANKVNQPVDDIIQMVERVHAEN